MTIDKMYTFFTTLVVNYNCKNFVKQAPVRSNSRIDSIFSSFSLDEGSLLQMFFTLVKKE